MIFVGASYIRLVGISIAVIALILELTGWWWLYQPSDGFNFGAGLVLVFAMALSLAGTVVLIWSLGPQRDGEQSAAIRRRWTAVDAAGKVGGALGVCYILIWLTILVLINFPFDPMPLEIAGFVIFAFSTILISASRP